MKKKLPDPSQPPSASAAPAGQSPRLFGQRPWLILGGLVLGAVALATYFFGPTPTQPLSTADVEQVVAGAMASATPPPAVSRDVYQFIHPALVLIQTETQAEIGEEPGFGVGSGVVVNEDGAVLTAWHVVDGASSIRLSFADGSQVPADVLAAEPANDTAVLMPLEPPGLIVPAILGNPGAMRVGDEAFAVGNPFGLAGSLSTGVISGFNRTLAPDDGRVRLEGLIQFDAAVNPGNSGGPLLNRSGHVIGIVTALANPTEEDFFIGIGFAVPIATAAAGAGFPEY